MSEEQFNHMDHRFRDAAENLEQPFEEAAWKRMEKLLDQEDERRRPFLWWWTSLGLLLVLVTGLYWVYSGRQTNHSETAVVQEAGRQKDNIQSKAGEIKSHPPVDKGHSTELLSSNGTQVNNNEIDNHQKAENAGIVSSLNDQQQSASHKKMGPFESGQKDISHAVKQSAAQVNARHRAKRMKQDNRQDMAIESPGDNVNQSNPVAPSVQNKNSDTNIAEKSLRDLPKQQDEIVTSHPVDAVLKTKPLLAEKNDSVLHANADTAKPAKKEVRDGPPKGFYFLAGLGADISSTRLLSFNHSPVAARYGLGIGYRFANKWSVQTGFYASAKKYLARPGDYKLSSSPYWNQVTLIDIDANCLVYEIPVQIKYDVIQRTGWSVFATAGISSYIMQKETYDYSVVRNYYPYTYTQSYTGNRHPFSVLGFSAGWQKNLGKKTAMMLEPYLQIPLDGVGEGKVRLYSFGLQTSFMLRPGKK